MFHLVAQLGLQFVEIGLVGGVEFLADVGEVHVAVAETIVGMIGHGSGPARGCACG